MNAGSPDSETIMAIAKIIKDLTKSKSKIVKIKRTSSNDWDVVFNISKLVEKLHIEPRNIRSGLELYVKEMNA